MRQLAILAAPLLLAACVTVPDRATALDRLGRANARAQAAVARLLPWLEPARAERVRLAAALVDAAIRRVAAVDPGERRAAIEDAERAIAGYRWEAAR